MDKFWLFVIGILLVLLVLIIGWMNTNNKQHDSTVVANSISKGVGASGIVIPSDIPNNTQLKEKITEYVPIDQPFWMGDFQWGAVSFSADYSRAAVWCPGLRGLVHVFSLSEGVWGKEATLMSSHSSDADFFGWSTAISWDGNVIVVWAPGSTLNEEIYDAGAVYVYVRTNVGWNEQGKLFPNDIKEGDSFGVSVSTSFNGDVILVGADVVNESRGAAYVFVRKGNMWTEQKKLFLKDGNINDYFGALVSISSDGEIATIESFSDRSAHVIRWRLAD